MVLFPILKKQNESAALGLLAARILESATIFVGVAFLLAIVSCGDQTSGHRAWPDATHELRCMTESFSWDKASRNATSFLGTILYRSRLVPRGLAMIGIIGGPFHRRIPRRDVRRHRSTQPLGPDSPSSCALESRVAGLKGLDLERWPPWTTRREGTQIVLPDIGMSGRAESGPCGPVNAGSRCPCGGAVLSSGCECLGSGAVPA